MPKITPAAVKTLKGLGCDTSDITLYDEKLGYVEGRMSASDSAKFTFNIITTTNYLDRIMFGGLDPAHRKEANWIVPMGGGKAKAFTFGGHKKFKFMFAMPQRAGDPLISKALKVLGWLPQVEGGKTYLHAFKAPAGTDFACAGGTISNSSEIMFPDKIPEAWFVAAYQVELKTGQYVPADITSLFG